MAFCVIYGLVAGCEPEAQGRFDLGRCPRCERHEEFLDPIPKGRTVRQTG
jgi:hypothetical protein